MKTPVILLLLISLCISGFTSCVSSKGNGSYRIIVSTDIGGTDFDDYQSMVHLLVYADTLDVEGIISSPYGEGRKEHILEAIDAYEKDYPNLKSWSGHYPTPGSLRKVVKQGAIGSPGPQGYGLTTEGSDWIIECARKKDARLLYLLIWGGIEDLAQALHDAPDILPKLRVYFIGGPNKKWSVDAYQYIAENFPTLWIIESNATYRGWFVGGNQSDNWSNSEFVKTYIKDCGTLGHYFFEKGEVMKMGDTPSLAFLLKGTPEDPEKPGWGGRYVRAWERPHKVFNRITNEQDSIEQFGVLELRLPFDQDSVTEPMAVLGIDQPKQAQIVNDTVRFLFSPKNRGKYSYTISSNIPSLDKKAGCIISCTPPATNRLCPSPAYPNWWTDDPSPEFEEAGHIGIKTVNIWREEFLTGFADRMKRCANVKPRN